MILIRNIRALWGVTAAKSLSGKEMAAFPLLENSYLKIENGVIEDFGSMDNFREEWSDEADQVIYADERLVLPAFCDSHTHLVYAQSREEEFVDRVRGLSYAEIARRGGGILNSADKLHRTSEEHLYHQAMERCREIIATGTGAVEIKSGYGLNIENEMKMLRVIARLNDDLPLTIKATLLGAHAVGREYAGRQEQYVDMICREMIPAVSAQGLANYVDVFCDEGFFNVAQTDQILQTAAKYSMRGKIHANELAISGGVQVGVENNALSVDHLEQMDDDAINALINSRTMPTALPGASFFLNIPFAPVRKMIDRGLPVAIASDFNPGSSPCGNMQFIMALAVIRAGLLPAEALTAATLNSAYAMGESEQLGSIAIGKKANLLVTLPLPSLNYMPYAYSQNHIQTIILNGKVL